MLFIQGAQIYLNEHQMTHTRGAPYHPMTQGKIERYHRSMKNVVKLEHYYSPWELERAIEAFVQYYNQDRYHEIINQRAQIKQQTLQLRRYQNLNSVPDMNQAM